MSNQAGVTAREAEVLALVGEHLSNAEIGGRLFISVRTVETHVSSLLRKLDVPDRRALARFAADRGAPVELPSPLTPFIGRVPELAALADAVKTHRQVTAVGPGGVGKTRLALRVASEVAAQFADGVWFVNLVPITDPTMVGTAVAGAVGIGEQQGRSMDESVLTALADRQALVVLDNCEHLGDGVAPFVERLLTRCPRLTVLATSRARLVVPFEHVHPVPPLSVDADAVELFVDRASAVGWRTDQGQRGRIAEICRKLDGIALAIELAAARLPVLGLDDLDAGLSDQLRLLTGGPRADDRHRSVRAALEWSHVLLAPVEAALLRRSSVFVAPFTADAVTEVAAMGQPVVLDGLARLAEHSLVAVVPSADRTRYRMLETIRQHGREQLDVTGELDATCARHLAWCLTTAADVTRRAGFDAVADDLRAALGWAAVRSEHRADAHTLAVSIAQLAFDSNHTDESQQRYEQAAALAPDPAAEASAFRSAAAVAGCRMLGDDVYRLHRAAADAALRAGDEPGAARDLAMATTTVYRFSGTFAHLPPQAEPAALLAEARRLASDSAARAAVALAECGVLADAFGSDLGSTRTTVAETTALAERAVELARLAGDPLLESAALDALTGAQCWAGETFAPAATTRRRADLITALPVTPASLRELVDVLAMATETCLGVGDVTGARHWGTRLRDLPLLAERGHFAISRLLLADALAGNDDDVLTGSQRFLDAWERSGRRSAPGLGMVAAAVAMVHGLRGDHTARAQWLGIEQDLGATPERRSGYGPVFDAIVLLHHGRDALPELTLEPAEMGEWITWIWGHWYAALRAEASVLARHPDAATRVTTARSFVAGNPVATAILDRADALLHDDRPRLLALATTFDEAGCHYQSGRTRTL